MEIGGKAIDTLNRLFPIYTGIELKVIGPGAAPERLYYAVGSREQPMHFIFTYEAGNTLIKGRLYESRMSAYRAILEDRFGVKKFSIVTKHLNVDIRGVSKRGIISAAGDTIPEEALKSADFYFEIRNCFLEDFLNTRLGFLVRTKYNDMIQQGGDEENTSTAWTLTGFGKSDKPMTATEVLKGRRQWSQF